jgi:hypothetical protein
MLGEVVALMSVIADNGTLPLMSSQEDMSRKVLFGSAFRSCSCDQILLVLLRGCLLKQTGTARSRKTTIYAEGQVYYKAYSPSLGSSFMFCAKSGVLVGVLNRTISSRCQGLKCDTSQVYRGGDGEPETGRTQGSNRDKTAS